MLQNNLIDSFMLNILLRYTTSSQISSLFWKLYGHLIDLSLN